MKRSNYLQNTVFQSSLLAKTIYENEKTEENSTSNELLLEISNDELPDLTTLTSADCRKTLQQRSTSLRNPIDEEIIPESEVINLNKSRISYLQRQISSISVCPDRQSLFSKSHHRKSVLEEDCLPPSSKFDGTSVLQHSILSHLSPRDIVLRRCGQSEPLDFSFTYSENNLQQCRKIGEGVFGEVFMTNSQNGENVVLKIIPIEGNFDVNDEPQKSFEQILPEIVIAMELSHLRNDQEFMTSGFVEVKNVRCVQGCYPEHLIDLWELYRDNCETENDHPEIFPENQLYIVLELVNGGKDLEAFVFQNALQSYSTFIQTALTLAVAEHKYKFEHRDLHWGNILICPTEEKEIIFKLNGIGVKVPTHGVKVTIIDYTLSRMIFEGCCLYNDLSNDNELFSASGDYQFDIYRLMKNSIDNQWERYDPFTNILWLHYTIDKMINGVRYRSSKTKKHRSAIQHMMKIRDELLEFKSASDFFENLKLSLVSE